MRSIRFNIWLLCALILASAAGTFLPQVAEDPGRVETFIASHSLLGPALNSLGFFDLFHSRWFLALWALMVLDIAACKLMEFPSRDPEARPEDLEKMVRSRPLTAKFTAQDADKAFSGIRGLLAREGYKVRLLPTGTSPLAAAAEIHSPQAWGSFISHASLVVILAGCLVKWLFGFQEYVAAAEGSSARVTKRPGWELRVDSFKVERYADTGASKSFESKLTLMENNLPLTEKTIRVNSPLSVQGINFYQDSWGATGKWRSARLAWPDREFELTQGLPRTVPGTDTKLTADLFAADFGVTPEGHADNLTTEPTNPALRVKEEHRSGLSRTWWLLQLEPSRAFLEDADGRLQEVPPPPFKLAAVDPVLFSGIQVVYDPGYPLVLAGSLAWLAGMVVNFYLHRRKFLVVVIPETSRPARVLVGGWSSQGAVAFKKDFDQVVSRMREVLS
ncbi:MAG: cytochrome c biogenesis protein ResB [Elusimicrobia bacterium]|nr:cytochrome c biogenesis protein ResB [Elusimicrobiota bacterium]